MRCPYCGENNPDDARRCSNCGCRLDKVREKKKEKNILAYGIILVIVILAAGIAAMFLVSDLLKKNESQEASLPSKVKITMTSTPEPTQEAVVSETPTPEPTEEVSALSSVSSSSGGNSTGSGVVKAELVDDNRKSEMSLMGFSQVTVASASASSTIQQDGIDNTPHVMTDGSTYSCWQEGVDGDGLGENVTYQFDREYKVKFLVLRLGNWYNAGDGIDYYTRNNRPEKMTFILGDQSFDVTFPDERREFCVEFSKEVPASSLKMVIDSVYQGTDYTDTCINEVDVYGY